MCLINWCLVCTTFSYSIPPPPFFGWIIYLRIRGKREHHVNDFSWDAANGGDKAESPGVPDGDTLSTNMSCLSSLVLIKSQEQLLLQWLNEVVCRFGRRKFSWCDFNHCGFLVMKFVISYLKCLRAGFTVAIDNPSFQRQLSMAEGKGKRCDTGSQSMVQGFLGDPKTLSEGLRGQSYFPSSLRWQMPASLSFSK